MFTIDNDMTINVTRGDCGTIDVSAPTEIGVFAAGDVLRLKIFEKKNCENVFLKKDFGVYEETNTFQIKLTDMDTKFGGYINKPTTYWYEIELNPFTEVQTIIGYDVDGPKLFILYPEGKDVEVIPPTAEEVGVVDKELSLTSQNAIENQAVARVVVQLQASAEKTTNKTDELEQEVALQRERINNFATLKEGSTTGDAELFDIRVGADGTIYPSAGESVRRQTKSVKAYADSVDVIEKCKNLIDESKIKLGALNATDGSETDLTTFKVTEYIYLNAGSYVYSNSANAYNNFRYCIYDLDKVFELSKAGEGFNSFTIDSPKYVRIHDNATRTKMQLEVGTTPTEYEEYVKIIKLEYIPIDDDFDSESEKPLKNKTIAKKFNSLIGVGKNLYNKANKIDGIACQTNQVTGEKSTTVNATTHSTSEWIQVEEGESYIFSFNGSATAIYRVHIADDKGVLVADYFTNNTNSGAIVIPLGGKQIRFSSTTDYMNATQFEKGTQRTAYEEYRECIRQDVLPTVGQSWFKGKTILFNGDSITEGTGLSPKTQAYPYLVCQELGANIINNAIGGSTLASRPENDTKNPLVLRYDTEISDAVAQTVDLVYIAIGSNDWAYTYAPLGTMEDRVTTTFYGALHLLCQGLLSKYAGKPIIFATPIKRRMDEAHTSPTECLKNGKTLKEYGEIIKEVCDFYSIPVLDMYSECGLTPFIDEQRDLYFQESSYAVHPNSEGAKIMARRVVAGIKSIVGI